MSSRPPVLALVATTLALTMAPAAHAKRCNLGNDAERLGATYHLSLDVKGVTCATGKDVVRAYHRCRKANGGVDGRCNKRVMGFRCTEERETISVQFSAKMRCRKGARRVISNYNQSTT